MMAVLHRKMLLETKFLNPTRSRVQITPVANAEMIAAGNVAGETVIGLVDVSQSMKVISELNCRVNRHANRPIRDSIRA